MKRVGSRFPIRMPMSRTFLPRSNGFAGQYVIGFTPPEEARDGRFHKLNSKMTRSDLDVRARNGYYAQAR